MRRIERKAVPMNFEGIARRTFRKVAMEGAERC